MGRRTYFSRMGSQQGLPSPFASRRSPPAVVVFESLLQRGEGGFHSVPGLAADRSTQKRAGEAGQAIGSTPVQVEEVSQGLTERATDLLRTMFYSKVGRGGNVGKPATISLGLCSREQDGLHQLPWNLLGKRFVVTIGKLPEPDRLFVGLQIRDTGGANRQVFFEGRSLGGRELFFQVLH